VATNHGGNEQLANAQNVLDRHETSSVDGICIQCGVSGPCPVRESAMALFSRSLRLPRRVPGATRPELVGARRLRVSKSLVSSNARGGERW
jgi:hypothetical protein